MYPVSMYICMCMYLCLKDMYRLRKQISMYIYIYIILITSIGSLAGSPVAHPHQPSTMAAVTRKQHEMTLM